MKILISPDGRIDIDVESVTDALEFVKAMRNEVVMPPELIPTGAWAGTPWNVGKAAHPEDQPTHEYAEQQMTGEQKAMSPALAELHEYMLDNDYPDGWNGWSPAHLAEAFDMKRGPIDQRLRALMHRGLVERVARGRYRAVK